jgi:hypothetical protein
MGRTNFDHIHACGDARGQRQLIHLSPHDAVGGFARRSYTKHDDVLGRHSQRACGGLVPGEFAVFPDRDSRANGESPGSAEGATASRVD